MEPLETTGHDLHVKSTKPQNYRRLDPQIDSPDMQDPIEPASTDVDERMTQDFKEAIERTDILDDARLQSSAASNEPSEHDISWRPDPSGHPHRTF